MINKIVSVEEAVAIVRNRDTVCVAGFVGIGTPEAVLNALSDRYEVTQSPKDLTLLFAAAPGDGQTRGLNKLARPGLVRRAIGGHWSLIPQLAKMAVENDIEAYNLPLGCISQLYRDIAAGKPGLLTKIGLHTFVDPRDTGGKINERTTQDLVKLLEIDGEDWLLYKTLPVNVAIIRGTTADAAGNITMEREALTLDMLPIAMAAKNSKGLVIAQVERVASPHTLAPNEVVVPGNLVDCVVVADKQEHWQTFATPYEHAYSGRMKVPVDEMVPMQLDGRKIIARRAALDLPVNGVVNLGIGMPEGVANVANEEKVIDYITLTAEAGIIGGFPQSGLDFGAAVNPDAIIQTNQQFDYYDGGGLDLACLGMAETDATGNVNVSRFGSKLAGAGGFINISQSARRLVFTGTFTAGGLKVSIDHGKLRIVQEGKFKKFVPEVEQITFNGSYAASKDQYVIYVTERCVFRLREQGLELVEVAPGIDIERDILPHMGFEPIIEKPKSMGHEMASNLFRRNKMGLKDYMLNLKMSARISYDPKRNILFANLSGMEILHIRDISRLKSIVCTLCDKLDHRVNLVANYDGIYIDPALSEQYGQMISDLEERFYLSAARYTTSAFMRLKLGYALAKREVPPHIFESEVEAEHYVAKMSNKGSARAAS